jgi:O-antigen ligase
MPHPLLPFTNNRFAGSELRAVAPASRSVGISWPIQCTIYAVVVSFYTANIYNRDLAEMLGIVKFASVGILCLVCLVKASRVSWQATNLRLIAVLTFPLAVSVVVSADDTLRSTEYLLSIVLVILTGQLLALLLLDAKQFQIFFDIVANVGRLVIVSSSVMWVLDLDFGRGVHRFSAWTDNPNTLGILLAPTLIMLLTSVLRQRRRWLTDGFFLSVGLFILFETGSRASIVWVVTSLLALIFGRRAGGLSLFLGLLGLAAVFVFGDDINRNLYLIQHDELYRTPDLLGGTPDPLGGRSEHWNLGLSLFEEQPWFGYGFGMSAPLIQSHIRSFAHAEGLHFHNSYLTILVEAGLIGLVVVTVVFLLSAVRGFRRLRARRLPRHEWLTQALPWAMIIGGLTQAFFETWLFSAGNANGPLFWTCFWLMRQGGVGDTRDYEGGERAGCSR